MGKKDGLNVLIFGATSLIAVHTARQLASRGYSFYLCARDEEKLSQLSSDLQIRGAAKVVAFPGFDATRPESITQAVNSAFEAFTHYDIVLLAHGYLPIDGEKVSCEQESQTMRINLLSCMEIVCAIRADYLSGIKGGVIAGISSVAGERGRGKNMAYCAAKAGMTAWLSGLRQQLRSAGVHVLTILPGPTDTPMLSHIPAGRLTASPQAVAGDIVKAIDKRRNVIYTPWYWRWIMAAVRHIPEFLFKYLKI